MSFVGVNETNANRTNHDVTVPAGTQAGRPMVLFFAANTTNPTYTYPAGWTAVGAALNGTGYRGTGLHQGGHGGRHPGTVVRVTSSALRQVRHGARRLPRRHRHRPPSAGRLETATTSAAHTSPTVNAPAGSKWLVTYWADKTSATTAWTPPAGQTFRSSKFGTLERRTCPACWSTVMPTSRAAPAA